MSELLPGVLAVFAFLALGDALAAHLPLGLPGSVLGMLLLAAACATGRLPVARIRPASTALARTMGLFIVPAGIGSFRYAELLRREWIPIVVASAVSTVVVFVTVGWTQQQLERRAP